MRGLPSHVGSSAACIAACGGAESPSLFIPGHVCSLAQGGRGAAGWAVRCAGRAAVAAGAAGLRRHAEPPGPQERHGHRQARLAATQRALLLVLLPCALPCYHASKRQVPTARKPGPAGIKRNVPFPPPHVCSVPELEFEIGAGAYVPFAGDLTTVADVLMQACKNLNMNQVRVEQTWWLCGWGGGGMVKEVGNLVVVILVRSPPNLPAGRAPGGGPRDRLQD